MTRYPLEAETKPCPGNFPLRLPGNFYMDG